MDEQEISLANTGKWYRQTASELHKWRAIKASIEAKQAAGLPIFVKLNDLRRKGSVGRLSSVNVVEQKHKSTYYTSSDYTSITFEDLEVTWDGRSNRVKPEPHQVTILLDHPIETGTVWVWNPTATARPKKERVVVKDALGQEVEPGHIVGFVYRYYGTTALKFGTVTRLTDAGTVFVQTLKLQDGQRTEEVRCYHNGLVIVNDALMNRLMLAKLAAI